jgi:hypothetical protein
MKKVLFTLLFSAILVVLQAQRPHCMTFEKTQEMKAADPLFGEQMRIVREQIDAYYNDPANFSSRAGIITIPVVFHVMHNGEAVGTFPNVSDAQLISQITQLNKDYRRSNSDTNLIPDVWKEVAADCEIEFCLASVDPTGGATTGITRHSMGSSGTWSDARKASTTWNRDKYLNIWIATIGGGTLGYTMFPGGAANLDGVVIDPDFIGVGGSSTAPFNKGRTASHEIGHWLGLDHTWGDDGSTCDGTDGIEDTPNSASEFYGCPTFPTLDACATVAPGVMYMDYMDYTDDGCMFMFTRGQKNKMLSVLNTVRSAIKTSNGCGAPATIVISGNIIDAATSAPVSGASLVFEGSSNVTTTSDGSGNFSVSIKAGNYNVYAGKWGYMTNRFSHNEAYNIGSAGLSIPIQNGVYYDDFSINEGWVSSGSAASAGAWVLDYPVETRSTSGNTITQTGHSLTTDFGSRCYITGNGTFGGSAGATDVDAGTAILTTPSMDLSTYRNPYIQYNRWFYGGTSDNEKIKISDGTTSVDIETITYTGSENLWTPRIIRVKDFIALSSTMTFSVEVTDAGTASTVEGALDRFMVKDSFQAGIANSSDFESFNLYPNPTKDLLNIIYQSGSQESADLKIFNSIGELIIAKSIQATTLNVIDIAVLSNGVYIVELSDKDHIVRRKVVKQ